MSMTNEELLEALSTRFDQIEKRFDRVEERLDRLEESNEEVRSGVNALLEWAEDLTDPQDNFRTGCAVMAYLSGKYGNTRDALSAYNTGSPGKTEYASAVLEAAENWR